MTNPTDHQQQQEEVQSKVKFSNANFPMTADGRVYHLDIKAGEVANKLILVGDLARAKLYADLYLEKGYFSLLSHRGYVPLVSPQHWQQLFFPVPLHFVWCLFLCENFFDFELHFC